MYELALFAGAGGGILGGVLLGVSGSCGKHSSQCKAEVRSELRKSTKPQQ